MIDGWNAMRFRRVTLYNSLKTFSRSVSLMARNRYGAAGTRCLPRAEIQGTSMKGCCERTWRASGDHNASAAERGQLGKVAPRSNVKFDATAIVR